MDESSVVVDSTFLAEMEKELGNKVKALCGVPEVDRSYSARWGIS